MKLDKVTKLDMAMKNHAKMIDKVDSCSSSFQSEHFSSQKESMQDMANNKVNKDEIQSSQLIEGGSFGMQSKIKLHL